jgi:hypothetical protein
MFDAYHKWLGIPPKDQPPNHYRLLGIDLFESDPDVIDAAANKQMAFLQGCSTGRHVALSQKLLNEIAAARLCLLNPAKKAAYDAKVKAQANRAANQGLVVPGSRADTRAVAPDSEAMTATPPNQLFLELNRQVASAEEEVHAARSFRSRRGARTRSRRPWKWPVILGGVALGVGFLVVLAVSLLIIMPPRRSSSLPVAAAEKGPAPSKTSDPLPVATPEKGPEPSTKSGPWPVAAPENGPEPAKTSGPLPVATPEKGPEPVKKSDPWPGAAAEKGPELAEPDKWAHLDLIRAAKVEGDFIRVPPGSALQTKEAYAGPIEVVLVARTRKDDIRLWAFNGACVIFNWEARRDELRVHRPDEIRVHPPDGNDTGLVAGSLATAWVQPLAPNTWYTLRWRITEQGMEVAVDGKTVFSERRPYDLSARRPVAVRTAESVVDVKSFDVKHHSAKAEDRSVVSRPSPVVAGKGPAPAIPDKWAHLDVGRAKVEGGFIRVPPGSALQTKEAYTGPIEVVVVARTQKNNIRLRAYNGACVIFNWERRQNELRVTRPDGNTSPESGSLATARVQPLAPNTWYTLRWRITEQGMRVSVNGKLVFSERRRYTLSARLPVVVRAEDSVVDVKSFDVRHYGVKN